MPGERSTGDTVHRLGITKAGNGRVRQALVENVWSYRHPPRTTQNKHHIHENLPPAVRDIAAKALTRLCARYRALSQRRKKYTDGDPIARELAGFIWAIGKEIQAASRIDDLKCQCQIIGRTYTVTFYTIGVQ